jgi:hypothetical protein
MSTTPTSPDDETVELAGFLGFLHDWMRTSSCAAVATGQFYWPLPGRSGGRHRAEPLTAPGADPTDQ